MPGVFMAGPALLGGAFIKKFGISKNSYYICSNKNSIK
jgi:hypothetical protein